jgi:DNA-binding FadR family transcriptional regulator
MSFACIILKTAIATPADEARQKLASGVITLQEARSIIDNHLAAVAAHGTDEDKVHLTQIVNQWRREVCLFICI